MEKLNFIVPNCVLSGLQFVVCALITCNLQSALVRGQFPRTCSTTEALQSRECCPLLNGVGSACGVEEGRGICSDIVIDNSTHGPPYELEGIDDRERWPERFFNR